ncbi:MAG: O-antigen ligase family protein [Actinomycetes bacterium]
MATALTLTICSLLAGATLVVRSATVRAWLMLTTLVVAPAILIVHVADAQQFATLRDRPALAAALLVAGISVVGVLAILFSRRPSAFPIAVVLTVPFRIPISIGGSTANLLLGLYIVVAAGAVAWAVPRLRRGATEDGSPPAALEWVIAAVLVLYSAQSAYGLGASPALQNIVFFYIPFALLFVLLARSQWTEKLAGRALAVLVGLALLLSAVGFFEFATRQIFLNPKVIASNQFSDYFRVNSVFFDPNIFGRFLVVVIVLLVAWICWQPRTRQVLLGGIVLLVLFGGLVITLSQSSFVALLAGLAVIAALRWSVRWTAALVLISLVVGVVALAAGTGALSGGRKAERATSGRAALVSGGSRLFIDRPLQGWGAGSFPRQYRFANNVSYEAAASASHTIPVTVAAEQGIIGLLAYLALLALAFVRTLRGARSAPWPEMQVGVAAAFVAIVVHTLIYAAFLEDPFTWVLLGVATALAAARADQPESAAPQ